MVHKKHIWSCWGPSLGLVIPLWPAGQSKSATLDYFFSQTAIKDVLATLWCEAWTAASCIRRETVEIPEIGSSFNVIPHGSTWPTIQLPVRKWRVAHTMCLSLSQIGLRYATGVSGSADRIQRDRPGPNKANHVLVMSLDYFAGVEAVCWSSICGKQEGWGIFRKRCHKKWPACMCI